MTFLTLEVKEFSCLFSRPRFQEGQGQKEREINTAWKCRAGKDTLHLGWRIFSEQQRVLRCIWTRIGSMCRESKRRFFLKKSLSTHETQKTNVWFIVKISGGVPCYFSRFLTQQEGQDQLLINKSLSICLSFYDPLRTWEQGCIIRQERDYNHMPLE